MTANEWAEHWRQKYSGQSHENLTTEDWQERRAEWSLGHLLALEKMVLGVMEATAFAYTARMPDPLPDLRAMAASGEGKHQFSMAGMYGGFSLELHDAAGESPYVLAECWSRVVGGSQMLRRITTRSVEIVSQGEF